MTRASIIFGGLSLRWITGSSPVMTTVLRPDRLLPIGQMHRAGAAGRMRRCVIGGNRGHWRGYRGRRLILRRDIIQHRRQPALGFGDAHALARGIILDLVALDLADAEIEAFRVAEIKPGYRRARPHRII